MDETSDADEQEDREEEDEEMEEEDSQIELDEEMEDGDPEDRGILDQLENAGTFVFSLSLPGFELFK